jgi:hypothetical protein
MGAAIEQRTRIYKQKQEVRLNERKQKEPILPGTQVMVVNHLRGSKWEPVYEGPYEVIQQHKGGAYSLRDSLGETMERRFTIEMLKIVQSINDLASLELSQLQEKKANDEESFEIQTIKNHRLRGSNGYEYLVKWKGFPDEDNSWVKAADFDSLKSITKYWKKLRLEKSKEKVSK